MHDAVGRLCVIFPTQIERTLYKEKMQFSHAAIWEEKSHTCLHIYTLIIFESDIFYSLFYLNKLSSTLRCYIKTSTNVH